jgi:hypothetical protein
MSPVMNLLKQKKVFITLLLFWKKIPSQLSSQSCWYFKNSSSFFSYWFIWIWTLLFLPYCLLANITKKESDVMAETCCTYILALFYRTLLPGRFLKSRCFNTGVPGTVRFQYLSSILFSHFCRSWWLLPNLTGLNRLIISS